MIVLKKWIDGMGEKAEMRQEDRFSVGIYLVIKPYHYNTYAFLSLIDNTTTNYFNQS